MCRELKPEERSSDGEKCMCGHTFIWHRSCEASEEDKANGLHDTQINHKWGCLHCSCKQWRHLPHVQRKYRHLFRQKYWR